MARRKREATLTEGKFPRGLYRPLSLSKGGQTSLFFPILHLLPCDCGERLWVVAVCEKVHDFHSVTRCVICGRRSDGSSSDLTEDQIHGSPTTFWNSVFPVPCWKHPTESNTSSNTIPPFFLMILLCNFLSPYDPIQLFHIDFKGAGGQTLDNWSLSH